MIKPAHLPAPNAFIGRWQDRLMRATMTFGPCQGDAAARTAREITAEEGRSL